jgi:DNA-binding NtrC family response regulator
MFTDGVMRQKSNDIGKKTILFMNRDPEESAAVGLLLQEAGLSACCVGSPFELKHNLREGGFLAVMIDLDSVAVDNRSIRELALQFPAAPFLCISRERLHPELKDSIRDHIYACLAKPVDPAELNYWLKCIREDDRSFPAG